MTAANILIQALHKAGEIQKEHFLKVHSIEQKESISSIVTEVDFLCDKAISTIIETNFPQHNLLTEESGFKNKGSEYTWIIDPLDGTSNFASGIPWFGILIALLKNETPVLAGAFLPLQNQLYFAEQGKGAFVNNTPLQLPETQLRNSLAGFGIDYTDNLHYLDFGMNLFKWLVKNSRNIRSTNSLVDWMLVAEGKMGTAVNLFTKIWDIAAPWLIIKEAGGMLEHLTQDKLLFNFDEDVLTRNYAVIAGSPKIVSEIKENVRDIQNIK